MRCFVIVLYVSWCAGLLLGAATTPNLLMTPREGKLPAGWEAESGEWKVVADPQDVQKQVIFVDGVGGMPKLTIPGEFPADYVVEFRARYDTPYPGMGLGGNPDGSHFPNWTLSLPGGVSVSDSFIWNGLVFQRDGKEVERIAGVRAKGSWFKYQFAKKGDQLTTYLDGHKVAQTTVPADVKGSAIAFQTQHERLWLGEIVARPYAPIAEASAKYAGDQWELKDNFESGKVGLDWKTDGNWSVVADPENPRNLVLSVTAEKSTANIETLDAGFKDYVMEFRARYDTAYKPYPNNDNIHFPHWGITIRNDAKGGKKLTCADSHIWSGQLCELNGQVIGGGDRKFSRAKWHAVKIACFRDDVSIYVDGNLVNRLDVRDLGAGSIGFYAMDETLWIDDLVVRPYPKPTAYAPLLRFSPKGYGSIYAAADEKGFDVQLHNDDGKPHSVGIEWSLKAREGSRAVLSSGEKLEFKAGESITKQITLTASELGFYDAVVSFSVDGRVFSERKTTLTIVPDQPAKSAAFVNKLALCSVGPGEYALARRLGAGWIRGEAAFAGLKKRADGSWDTSAASAAMAEFGRYAPMKMVHMWMNQGEGHKLTGIDQTAEMFAAAARNAVGRQDPQSEFEVWNEPNHSGFWRLSPINAADFTALLKPTYNAIKSADPNAIVNSFSLSGADGGFLRGAMENGAWPYVDMIGYHPYGYPTIPETLLPQTMRGMKQVSDEFGGWIDYHITEHGYPTVTTSIGVSEQVQADDLVRLNLLANSMPWLRALHIYTLHDSGDNPQNVEHRFGIIRTDRTAKPSFLALAVMSASLANTEYMGIVPAAKEQYIQVYRRYDGCTVLAAWTLGNANVVVPIRAASATVISPAGRRAEQAITEGRLNLSLTASPLYVVLPAGESALLLRAVNADRQDRATFVRTQVGTLTDESTRAVLLGELDSADSAAAALLQEANPSTRQLEAALDPCDSLVKQTISLAAAGKIPFRQASSLCDGIYRYMQVLTRAYSVTDTPAKESAGLSSETLLARMRQRAGQSGSLVASERILAHAGAHARRAGELAGSDKAASGIAAGEGAIARRLLTMAEQMIAVEPVFYRGTLCNVLPRNVVTAPGSKVDLTTTFSNGQSLPADVAVEIEYPASWKLPMKRLSRKLEPSKRWVEPMSADVPADAPGEQNQGQVKFYLNGQLLETSPVHFSVIAPVKVALLPLSTPLGETRAITVNIQNLLNTPFEGSVEIVDPAGRQLASNKATVRLAAGASGPVTFDISCSTAVPMNELAVEVTVRNRDGAAVFHEKMDMDFTLTAFTARPPTIDGDLSDWKDAFPVHLHYGEGPTTSQSFRATAWTLMDQSNLYVAVRVFDLFHSQEFVDGNLWQGDSIQISIDPQHQRTEGAYGANDIEVGFATDTKCLKQLSVIYASPNKAILDKAIFRVVRDDAKHETRYELAIPLSEIRGLSSAKGYQFGFNLAVHDANKSFSRERLLEYTEGTSVKNPSAYRTWSVRR